MNVNTMTPSQWLDVAVLAVAFIAAISGWRSGALGSLLSFVGVLLGAMAGVLLAPHLVTHIAAPRAKLFTALFLILALVVVGEVSGVVLGRAVRSAIRSRTIRAFDSMIGVGVQLVVVLTAAWLLATPLTQSHEQPELASAVRGSRVLARVNEIAPAGLKAVPKRLSALLNTSGLPAVSSRRFASSMKDIPRSPAGARRRATSRWDPARIRVGASNSPTSEKRNNSRSARPFDCTFTRQERKDSAGPSGGG